MKEYLDNPEATAEMITDDGWLHSGDVAIYDKEGRFQIVDRIKELIKVKGFQVRILRLFKNVNRRTKIYPVWVLIHLNVNVYYSFRRWHLPNWKT